MSFVAVGTAVGTAAIGYAGSRKQGKASDKAADQAEKMYAKADKILSGAAERSLSLPQFNAVDKTGDFKPVLQDIFGEQNVIKKSFDQDIQNASGALPGVQ